MMPSIKPEIHPALWRLMRLVQRLQSSVCPCRVQLQGPVQFAIIRGIRLVGNVSPKLLLTLRGSSPHVKHCFRNQAHSLSQTAYQSSQLFLYGSQMLCCTMHCQWGKYLKIAPFFSDFVIPPEEDRATAIGNMHKIW